MRDITGILVFRAGAVLSSQFSDCGLTALNKKFGEDPMKLKSFSALAAFAAVAWFGGLAAAQPFPVVDGTVDAIYGAPIAVQTVQTGFGDTDGVTVGSELDAAYVAVCDERLFMVITGNVEQNFNKLNIFFDTKSGGENVLSSDPEYDFDPGGGAWISKNFGGHTFDAGFEADFHMFVRSGGGDNYEVDWIDRLGGTGTAVNGNGGSAVGLGTVAVGSLANNAVASALANDISFFFDNSNLAGVIGAPGGPSDPPTPAANQANAAAVTTGFEFSIDFADLSLDPMCDNEIKVAAIMGNSNHNYHSNQILAGLPAPQGNLGGDNAGGFSGTLSGVDFTAFAGDQFMTIDLPAKGDANDDGKVNNLDITAFGQALFDPVGYAAAFPNVDPDVQLDINCDGSLNNLDISAFGGLLGF